MILDPNYTRGLAAAIDRSSASEQTLTNELSSGLRVTRLSDDPVAAAQNVGMTSSISRLDSFVKSSTEEQSRMQVADNALGEVVSQVTKAISLAVGAGNGTLSAADLKAVQTQMENVRDSVLALGNTTYAGQYVFAGSRGATRPFTLDTTSDPAVATYHGDTVPQTLETPDGQKVAVNVAGSNVLMSSGGSVLGTLNQLISDLGAAAAGTGSSASIQTDAATLTQSLGSVTGQRATLDSGLSRMTTAGTYAQTQAAVYTAQQSTLLSADPAAVATDLKTAETQQQALLAVASTLDGQQDLFSYMR